MAETLSKNGLRPSVRAVHCDYRASDEEVYQALKRATDPLDRAWDKLRRAKTIAIKFNQDWVASRVVMHEGHRQQLVSDPVARASYDETRLTQESQVEATLHARAAVDSSAAASTPPHSSAPRWPVTAASCASTTAPRSISASSKPPARSSRRRAFSSASEVARSGVVEVRTRFAANCTLA